MYWGKKTDPFYKSPLWRRARRMALERDFYICQDCMQAHRQGEMIAPRAATTVHHILSREERPELALELTNLISLCDACHNKRHPEKGAGAAKLPVRAVRVIKV